ncbi:MAG: hypothetical protein Kow00108_25840 [Calditrichia bacterium]
MKNVLLFLLICFGFISFQCKHNNSHQQIYSSAQSIPRFMISAPQGWELELRNPPVQNTLAIITPENKNPKNPDALITVSLIEKDSILTIEHLIDMDKEVLRSKFGDIRFQKLPEIQLKNKNNLAKLYKVTAPDKTNFFIIAYIEEANSFISLMLKSDSTKNFDSFYQDFITVVKSYTNITDSTI